VTRILVVDNYDSFVFTLVQYLAQLGAHPEVVRNDEVDLTALNRVEGLLISPGPGTPEHAGSCLAALVAARERGLPVLGVCLGHQVIAVGAGSTVDRAPELLPGKTSEIHHDGSGVLVGLPSPFTPTRYHSLAIVESSLTPGLHVTARSESGVIMGVRLADEEVHGVQFHPESVLTQGGHRLLANWLEICGNTEAVDRSAELTVGLVQPAG